MRVLKGFSGILLIKKVWDGSFIIHYEDDYYRTKETQFYFHTERSAIQAFRRKHDLVRKRLHKCYLQGVHILHTFL